MLVDDEDQNNQNLDRKFANEARTPEQAPLCIAMNNSGLFDTEDLVIENLDEWIDLSKQYLYTKGFDHARNVLNKMLDYNEDIKRKDGKTPSVIHEMTQFTWLTSCLDNGLFVANPEGVIINDLAHDLGEDHGVKPDFLLQMLIAYRPIDDVEAAGSIGIAHGALSKEYLGEEKDDVPIETTFKGIALSQNASVVKILDRIHNISTHIGVKDAEKSASYIKSTRDNFIPLIEGISKEFYPDQTDIYDTLLDMLTATCELTEMHYNGEEMPDNDTILDMMPERGFKNLPRGINPLLVVANRSRAMNLSSDPDMNIQQG